LGTITWTSEAQPWLEDIFEYIAIDDRNAASQVVDDKFERAQILKDNPEIGFRYRESVRHEGDETYQLW